jgi:hypothetical protein
MEKTKELIDRCFVNLPYDIRIPIHFKDYMDAYILANTDEPEDTTSPLVFFHDELEEKELTDIVKSELRDFLHKRLYEFCWCDSFETQYHDCHGKEEMPKLLDYITDINMIKPKKK